MRIGLMSLHLYGGGLKHYYEAMVRYLAGFENAKILSVVATCRDDVQALESRRRELNPHAFEYEIALPQSGIGKVLLQGGKIDREIQKIVDAEPVDVWLILWSFYFVQRVIFGSTPVGYVVHDVKPHEHRAGIRAYVGRKILDRRIEYNRNRFPCLITNSRFQAKLLEQLYPDKIIEFIPFPTHVVGGIESGREETPELKGKEGYILFFGRIEYYKGLHLLLEAYRRLPADKKPLLVAAGLGKAYFDKRLLEDNKVLFINRFIRDEEVGALFRKAAFVVYPYVSATQVGPLCLAYHYGKPIVISDVEALLENFDSERPAGKVFQTGDIESLHQALTELLNLRNLSPYVENSLHSYQLFYAPENFQGRTLEVARRLIQRA